MTEAENQYHPEVRLEITGDGSQTLFVPSLDEHYHSVFGAITESMHIFIDAGLRFVAERKDKIDILEVGLGTGLNALLTFVFVQERQIPVHYTALEKFPLPIEMSSQLNFSDQMSSHFKIPNQITSHLAARILKKIHESPWNEWIEISSYFHLHKVLADLEDYRPDSNLFDLVYFDAFGPDKQPGMWTADIFNNIYAGMKQGGVLVTYSTKGEVKRNLKNAGFFIEKLPGPPGKREILRATKK